MADSKAWELGLERKVSAGTSWQRRLYPTLGTSGGYATLRGLFDLLDLTGSAAVRLVSLRKMRAGSRNGASSITTFPVTSGVPVANMVFFGVLN
ncbi:uncharacterized protein SEPMUDRAFT_116736 [Sphaerulina musiva SO2202]|uniref:Uncharacterized protein n=1 Tax=Sphaerulina musiva (strain SO2202) TaxID=692275 RepID=M3D6B0_SPHMS|nr:uncharacterized protein SEPMUDRAFT_116736 [Sphaerulina musiva SO2202]EMF13715.1 hypothetical protein SEPMUDRAFT_116736 [Sphaerulina musiva SO2202]